LEASKVGKTRVLNLSLANDVDIRLVVQSDLSQLEEICRQHAIFEQASWKTYDNRIGKWSVQLLSHQPRARCWVAVQDTTICGYVACSMEYSLWRAGEYLNMDCLFVIESHRNRGLGTLLMANVLAFAQENEIQHLEWQTPAWNLPAIQFYRLKGASHTIKCRFSMISE
jgi:GNAT superfamily N-acetyltransferase